MRFFVSVVVLFHILKPYFSLFINPYLGLQRTLPIKKAVLGSIGWQNKWHAIDLIIRGYFSRLTELKPLVTGTKQIPMKVSPNSLQISSVVWPCRRCRGRSLMDNYHLYKETAFMWQLHFSLTYGISYLSLIRKYL